LDRYVARQLIPVWVWCLAVFTLLSCLIDLFEHLDEIYRYRIPAQTILRYYLHFVPIVFVRASPLALLLGGAFVAGRLARHQEFLAMHASGTSLLRASVPFLFVGWMASACVFAANELLVPPSARVYERIRQEAFRGRQEPQTARNVAIMDAFNRLYHARELDLKEQELYDLTILEHDRQNRPLKSVYAERAVWTKHGWLLLNGRIYRVGPGGRLRGEPELFPERLLSYPVTPESFNQSETQPESMRYAQLRLLLIRLKQTGIKSHRYAVDLAAKLTLPLMNLVVCLIAFAGSTQLELRGNLKGLGISLGWGLAYYLFVGFWEGLGKRGMLPAVLAVWLPHLLAVWGCLRILRKAP
jgi:lipopolysaccharide export system permease protein